jgi:hypothetical protein
MVPSRDARADRADAVNHQYRGINSMEVYWLKWGLSQAISPNILHEMAATWAFPESR